MFDLFRSRDKAVRYLLGGLLGLVALSMVITLIPGYGSATRAPEQVIAEVGKEQITVREVQTTLQGMMRNKSIPPEMVQLYIPQLVDQMINERALAYQAKRMGFEVSEAETANAIRSVLSQLFPTGEFNKEVYERFLSEQGLTIGEFESNIAKNLLVLKLRNIALDVSWLAPTKCRRPSTPATTRSSWNTWSSIPPSSRIRSQRPRRKSSTITTRTRAAS